MEVKMVAYEPRAFMHDSSYQALTDTEPDHAPDGTDRYGETDVSELASYHAAPEPLLDDQQILGDHDQRPIIAEEAAHESRMDIAPAPTMAMPSVPETIAHTPASGIPRKTEASDAGASAATPTRVKLIPKPDREVSKHPDGKFYCTWTGCAEVSQGFNRRCEWSKHMDKHERPYRCDQHGCEKLPGFTYSGGLLRHQREVHGKHGGPKNTFNCPYTNCKRHAGKGFSRQENLNEHLRRVHTEGASPGAADEGAGNAPSDSDSEKAGHSASAPLSTGKRKRSRGGSVDQMDDDIDIREEMKRLRHENEQLRDQVDRHREEQLNMMAQIADLQGALRIHTATMASPTSMM